MRTSLIEMGDPRFEDDSDVAFIQGNHEVQTFPSGATDQAFTKSIRLARPAGGPPYSQTHRSKCRIEFLGIAAVPVLSAEVVGRYSCARCRALLPWPFRLCRAGR